jgi:hypothetical protein
MLRDLVLKPYNSYHYYGQKHKIMFPSGGCRVENFQGAGVANDYFTVSG